MTTRNKNRFALALALFLPLQICLGQAPSGIVSFDFGNTNSLVWDLSGTLIFEQTMIGAASQESPLAFGVEVTHGARGQLTGTGATLVTVGNDSIAAQYTVQGRVSGGGSGPARASIDVILIGEDVVAGINTVFRIKVHYNLEASTDDRAFIGRASGSASFRELSSARIRSDVSVAAPGSMDGSWSVQMNIIPLRRLGGSGSIILSNDRVLPTHLSGSYSSSSAIANVKLVGVDEAAGISANVKFISSEDGTELQSIKGKILGQTVRQ